MKTKKVEILRWVGDFSDKGLAPSCTDAVLFGHQRTLGLVM